MDARTAPDLLQILPPCDTADAVDYYEPGFAANGISRVLRAAATAPEGC